MSFEELKLPRPVFIQQRLPTKLLSNLNIKQWAISDNVEYVDKSTRDRFEIDIFPIVETDILFTIKARCKQGNVKIQFTLRPSDRDFNTSGVAGVKTADTLKASIILGKMVYTKLCAACHGIEGKGIPSIFPGLANSKLVKDDLTGDELFNVIYNGRAKTAMAAYREQLSTEEIASLVNYIKTQWSGRPWEKNFSVKNMRRKLLK